MALESGNPPYLFLKRMSPDAAKIAREDEVVFGLEPKVSAKVDRMLLNPDKAWQPSDLLPSFEKPDWIEDVVKLRTMAAGLSKGLVVATAGNGITEEGAPLYARALERIPTFSEPSGKGLNGFGRWGLGWDSEENRHKIVFDRWMWLSGRVDMKAYDTTVHHFIANGFGGRIGQSVYNALIFTSHQEPATKISHERDALLARSQGDEYLHRISLRTSGEEARHGEFYGWLYGEVFDADPNGAVVAAEQMFDLDKGGILMPGALMSDKKVKNVDGIAQTELFQDYSLVTQALGIYTAADYNDITRSLLTRWRVFDRTFDTPEAREAQERLGKFTVTYGKVLERAMSMKVSSRFSTPPSFSWIHDEPVPLHTLKEEVAELKRFQESRKTVKPETQNTEPAGS